MRALWCSTEGRAVGFFLLVLGLGLVLDDASIAGALVFGTFGAVMFLSGLRRTGGDV